MFGRRLLSNLIICFLIGDAALCDEPPDFTIKREVPIEAMLGGQFALVVDVGRLPSNSKGRIEIDLINNNSIDFSVDELKVGCSCTKASFSTDSIKPFSSAKLQIDLETPSTSKVAEKSVSVRLVSAKNFSRSINVLVKYQLSGLMCFKEEVVMQEIGSEANVQRISIPFVITPPINPSDISFQFAPHSEGMRAELTTHNDSYNVEVSIDPVFVTANEASVTLTAKNSVANLTDTVVLSLLPIEPIQISPSRTVFRSTDAGWQASSILRIQSDGEQVGEETMPYVEVLLNDKKINVESKRLAQGIFRLTLRSNEDPEVANAKSAAKPSRLKWRVTTASKVHRGETTFVLARFPLTQSPF